MNRPTKKDLLSINEDGLVLWYEKMKLLNKILYKSTEGRDIRILFNEDTFDNVKKFMNMINRPPIKVSFLFEYFDVACGILSIKVRNSKEILETVDMILNACSPFLIINYSLDYFWTMYTKKIENEIN